MTLDQPCRIAVAFRTGPDERTNDDPVLIQRNVDAMEDIALAVFRRGHLPVLGEWFALPLLKHAGSKKIGDAVFDEIFHPMARDLMPNATRCSASADRRTAPTTWSRPGNASARRSIDRSTKSPSAGASRR